MSALSSFYLLDISKIDDLKHNAKINTEKSFFSKKVVDTYWNFLANNAEELNTLDGSGYIYGNILAFLQEKKDIDLLENEYSNTAEELIDKRGIAHFIFSHEQKNCFLSRLNPVLFPLTELQIFNQEFSDDYDEETARMCLGALKILHDNLAKVENKNQVLLLIIG